MLILKEKNYIRIIWIDFCCYITTINPEFVWFTYRKYLRRKGQKCFRNWSSTLRSGELVNKRCIKLIICAVMKSWG